MKLKLIFLTMTAITLTSVMGSGCDSANATAPVDSVDQQSTLEAAHHAYLEKNYKQAGKQIKNLLFANPDVEVKANALNLLNLIYEDNCDYKFPADWRLPEGVVKLKFEQARALEPDGMWYKTKLSGHLDNPDRISQLKLTRYPNDVILDKNAGKGEWSVEVNPDDPSDIYYELALKYGKTTVEPGLYTVDIVTDDGSTTNGWFIMTNQLSSASPVVHSPAVGEKYSTGSPTFNWDDFKSPEYQTCETRRLKIYASKIPSDFWDVRWSLGETDPNISTATIGVDGIGDQSLEQGQYWFSLGYQEWRKFGPMRLIRRSVTSRHFYVE